MKTIEGPLTTWEGAVSCQKCRAVLGLTQDDVLVEEFKVSGYFFAGTEVCEDKAYVICPHCNTDVFIKDPLPYLVVKAGKKRREEYYKQKNLEIAKRLGLTAERLSMKGN